MSLNRHSESRVQLCSTVAIIATLHHTGATFSQPMSDAPEPAPEADADPIEILHAIEYPASPHTRLNTRTVTIKGWCFDCKG